MTEQPSRAFVRSVSDSFVQAVTGWRSPDGGHPRLDVERARTQHRAYVGTLRQLGLDVCVLPADDDYPDCCFIEDTVVVGAGTALLTRSAHPARRGEGGALAGAYREAGLDVIDLEPPATLDGGDVLRVGRRLYVGLTARTNHDGILALKHTFEPLGYSVRTVDMPAEILHLKCVVSLPAPDVVLLAESTLDPGIFSDHSIISIPWEERYAANTVGCHGTVVVADGFPRTQAALETAGLRTIALDTSEFRRADGSLTCLSVIL